MKKTVYTITGVKGGCGKSLLCFMMAEKYKNATILDLDDATTTSMKQLAYRNPILVSFLDPDTQRIDRGAFNSLFESIAEAKKDLFICDIGSSVSEQLPKYFKMNDPHLVRELLDGVGIDLHIVCVIGGGNTFKASMEYLVELVDACSEQVRITVALNGIQPLADEQEQALNAYLKQVNLPFTKFDLVKDKGEMAMRIVADVLSAGKGTSGLSPFTAIYFRKPIQDLQL